MCREEGCSATSLAFRVAQGTRLRSRPPRTHTRRLTKDEEVPETKQPRVNTVGRRGGTEKEERWVLWEGWE